MHDSHTDQLAVETCNRSGFAEMLLYGVCYQTALCSVVQWLISTVSNSMLFWQLCSSRHYWLQKPMLSYVCGHIYLALEGGWGVRVPKVDTVNSLYSCTIWYMACEYGWCSARGVGIYSACMILLKWYDYWYIIILVCLYNSLKLATVDLLCQYHHPPLHTYTGPWNC